MSDDSTQGDGLEPPSVTGRIDEICDRFEATWKKGARPTVEEYLGEMPEPSRRDLFGELLVLELAYRQRERERPEEDEYRKRFPQYEQQIAAAFSRPSDRVSVKKMADAERADPRALHIRCPHCHSPIELVDDSPLEEISCPSCGSSFGLIGDEALAFKTTGGTLRRRQNFAHFELVEQLGSGAFGVVWRARDTQLDRTVALKIPRKGHLDRAETEMFMREARAAAQLRHANIVSVHEVGLEGDTVYMVSDFVEGLSLQDYLTGQKYTYRESAELCAKIAEAIHFAHEQGVIHRDLKPSNILMDGSGEPHITDFGLAKREAGEITMTMDGQILGTPAYMSPEQAQGEGHAADRRSDVYSLGVMLFELLTGERPFRGNARMLLKQVVEDEAPRPRKLDRNIPRDLETICLKCLEKEPGQRYATAKQLAEDLGRFINGEAVLARPISQAARLWRWCRRNPLAASVSVLVPLAVSLIGLAVLTARHAEKGREVADLKLQIETCLSSSPQDAGYLVAVEQAIADLQPLDSAVAEYYRARLHSQYADFVRREIRNLPRLTADDQRRIDTAISELRIRDATLAAALQGEFLQRWSELDRVLIELGGSFESAGRIFANVELRREQNGLIATGTESQTGAHEARLVVTGVVSDGDVRAEAEFDGPWYAAVEVGVVLGAGGAVADDDAAETLPPEAEYELLLRVDHPRSAYRSPAGESQPSAATVAAPPSFAETKRQGGSFVIEVRRNGNRLGMRVIPAEAVALGPLRIAVDRSGRQISVRVNDIEPLVIEQMFLGWLPGGYFALRWPGGASLKAFHAARRERVGPQTPFEQAEQRYNSGEFSLALGHYEECRKDLELQRRLGQELRYKRAACLVEVGRATEAKDEFVAISSANGDRWPVLAGCQLWRLYLSKEQLAGERERIYESVTSLSDHTFESLAAQLPEEEREKLVERSRLRISGGFHSLRVDATRLTAIRRLVRLHQFLDVSLKQALDEQESLMTATHLVGELKEAAEIGESLLRSPLLGPYSKRYVMGQYVWILINAGQEEQALQAIDQRLFDADGDVCKDYLALFIERARVNAVLGRWDDARRDLLAYRKDPNPKPVRAYVLTCLLLGFVETSLGNPLRAEEAWTEGYEWAKKKNLHGELDLEIMGSLTDAYTPDDAQATINAVLDASGPVKPFDFLRKRFLPDAAIASVLRNMWQTSRGREVARRIALHEVTRPEKAYLQAMVTCYEIMRQCVVGSSSLEAPLTPAQDEVLWRLCELYYDAYQDEEINLHRVILLIQAWKGPLPGASWQGASPYMSPELRAHFAYAFGCRYFHRSSQTHQPESKQWRAGAIQLLTTARNDAPEDSELRELATQALEQCEEAFSTTP